MIVFPFGAMVRRQQHIVAQFQRHNATSETRAAMQNQLGVEDSHALRILRRESIIRGAGETRLYLDESRWSALESRRGRLGVLIPIVVGIAALCAWMLLRRS